jgi:hypothetical protein
MANVMNQFTFTSKQKNVLFAFMGLGLLCLILTWFSDDALHTRFWSNFLHNATFFTGISFVSLFVITAFTTAWAGWYVGMKRIWEANMQFILVGLGLMLIVALGIWGHFHHLYHWSDEAEVAKDAVMKGKASFLNKYWYTLSTLIILGMWAFFAYNIRKISLDEDINGKGQADNFKHHRKIRVWSVIFMPLAGFSSAAIIWQWIMSVDAHWYSTLFAWYSGVSWFVSMIAITILTLIYLKSLGYFSHITADHMHDLGKLLFAFSIFWTYMWFSQYMLIWYANVGEETVYFYERLQNYKPLFYANLLINFLLPFFVLMRNDNKRKFGPLAFAAIMVFIGHWLDFFLMIKPGVRHTALEALGHHHAAGHDTTLPFQMGFTMPGFLEVGTMLGFLALYLFITLRSLSKAALFPKNDPYAEEATHHHVWPYV